ncbi:MAG: hypothetical protein GX347_04600 [Epulopiscium sp.]|nr:hypothetical protein [Candidatus Epulonipiscium sp.]
MVEEIYSISTSNQKTIEKVIQDDNIHYLHMIFNKDEGLPEHFSNSTVYMTVVRGILSIGLNEQDIHEYSLGHVLKIPYKTKMNVKNLHEDVLELIVIKSPAPKSNPNHR